MGNAAATNTQYDAYQGKWEIVTTATEGEDYVKAQGDKYLPRPNPSDTSDENKDRYKAYLERAVFYEVTARTLEGMVGLMFAVDPEIQVPPALEPMLENVDGAGVDMAQFGKQMARWGVGWGRAGILVDYPVRDEATTEKQIMDGEIRPTLTWYGPEAIRDWDHVTRGADLILSKLVLQEYYEDKLDFFESETKVRYRVLFLYEGEYWLEIVAPNEDGDVQFDGIPTTNSVQPLDANGQPFDRIPWVWLGSVNNDANVDKPPLEGIARLNIAHYRNSADYEEASYVTGQPTLALSGLTDYWVKDVLGGQVRFGSRGAVLLPEGGSAQLLQAKPNTMPKEAMDQKEKQMLSMGAQLITPSDVDRQAATAALIEDSAGTSPLASIARNVDKAMMNAISIAGKFTGDDTSAAVFKIDTEFLSRIQTAAQRQQLLQEWTEGAISFSEMRDNLRKIGVATLDDATAQTEIDADLDKKAERARKLAVPADESDEDDIEENNDTDEE